MALVVVNFLVFAGTVTLNQLSAFPEFAGGEFCMMVMVMQKGKKHCD